jgi:2'-5' RNA ligase
MPRLFTGIELPPDLVFRLSLLRDGLPGAHWIDAANYHITLRFAGDMPDRTARAFSAQLNEIAFDAFDLEISGLGSFGGNKPRAIWAAVKPSAALSHLQRAHERAARLAGLEPEPRNFVPHVTLARMRGGRADIVADYLARHGSFKSGPFPVNRFVLFSSRPNIGGGPYVVEEEYDAADDRYAGLWTEAQAL